jgi:hypothetical protein
MNAITALADAVVPFCAKTAEHTVCSRKETNMPAAEVRKRGRLPNLSTIPAASKAQNKFQI